MYVQPFVKTLNTLDSSFRVVRDWVCVPGNANMSIDALVLCGWRWCANFEIDGPCHFREWSCIRMGIDAEKDALVLKQGWGLMRLHYMDEHLWGKYVKHHVMRAAPHVLCTQSYQQYLMGEQGSHEIVYADRLEE